MLLTGKVTGKPDFQSLVYPPRDSKTIEKPLSTHNSTTTTLVVRSNCTVGFFCTTSVPYGLNQLA